MRWSEDKSAFMIRSRADQSVTYEDVVAKVQLRSRRKMLLPSIFMSRLRKARPVKWIIAKQPVLWILSETVFHNRRKQAVPDLGRLNYCGKIIIF